MTNLMKLEQPSPAPLAKAAWRDPFYWWVAAALAVYTIALGVNIKAYAFGSDPSGYLNHARLLVGGSSVVEQRAPTGFDRSKFHPMTFVPLSFKATADGRMIPVYPAGLPAAVAAVAQVTGWKAAPHATMLLMALLGILATVWLGSELGLPRPWAWLTAALLAAGPLYNMMAMNLMSDVPALVSVTAAMAMAWKSRTRAGWAFGAGMALAYSVFVRPTDLLVVLAAGVCMGGSVRRWVFFCLGGLPGAVIWCLYNRALTGHFFVTGYGSVSEHFSWGAVPQITVFYIRWLPVLATPVGVCALGLPWLWKRPGGSPAAMMLMAWIVAFLLFYVADIDSKLQWGGLRYVLPVFPACLAGGLMVIREWGGTDMGKRFTARLDKIVRGRGWAVAVCAVAIFGVVCTLRFHIARAAAPAAIYPEASEWAVTHLPADALIIGMDMTGTLYCYTSFEMARTDWLDEATWPELVRECAAAHKPLFAVMHFPYDLSTADRALAKNEKAKDGVASVQRDLELRFPGKWTEAGGVDAITFWRLDTGGK